VLVKAIRFPSRDQLGYPSKPAAVVSRVTPLPSAFITYTSAFPPRELSKAIFVPSGDQTAKPSKPGESVSRVTAAPLVLMT